MTRIMIREMTARRMRMNQNQANLEVFLRFFVYSESSARSGAERVVVWAFSRRSEVMRSWSSDFF